MASDARRFYAHHCGVSRGLGFLCLDMRSKSPLKKCGASLQQSLYSFNTSLKASSTQPTGSEVRSQNVAFSHSSFPFKYIKVKRRSKSTEFQAADVVPIQVRFIGTDSPSPLSVRDLIYTCMNFNIALSNSWMDFTYGIKGSSVTHRMYSLTPS